MSPPGEGNPSADAPHVAVDALVKEADGVPDAQQDPAMLPPGMGFVQADQGLPPPDHRRFHEPPSGDHRFKQLTLDGAGHPTGRKLGNEPGTELIPPDADGVPESQALLPHHGDAEIETPRIQYRKPERVDEEQRGTQGHHVFDRKGEQPIHIDLADQHVPESRFYGKPLRDLCLECLAHPAEFQPELPRMLPEQGIEEQDMPRVMRIHFFSQDPRGRV